MTPIFIGGSPRSGTTLLGAMLGAHPQVVCPPEAPFIGSLALALRSRGNDRGTEKVHRAIRANYKFAFWKLRPEDLEACDQVAVTSYRELIDEYVSCFARQNARSNPAFWVDHTPNTVMYSARLFLEFPHAKFIHLVRDGRAVCASWMPLNWGPNTIIWAARTWAMHVGYGLAAEMALPAASIRRITYESLVGAPETVLKPLCQWLGLSYQPAMLTSSGLRVPAYTRSQHGLIGGPADPTRIEGWRNKLTAREIELFEYVTGDLLVNLGYELAASAWLAEPSRLEMARIELTERARQLSHVVTRPFRAGRSLIRMKRDQSTPEYARE